VRRQSPPSRISPGRRRGLVRLGILLASAAALVVALTVISGSSGGGTRSGGRAAEAKSAGTSPAALSADLSTWTLPVPLHGQAVAAAAGGLLVVGGETGSGASTDRVYRFDPISGKTVATGSLAQPLHDAAAATVGEETLVFGGGSTSTLDLVQALKPGAVATQVGRLPDAESDLSAVALAGGVYVLGGYDGSSPSASVLQTANGRAFERVARLQIPVRYTAAAALGDRIYAFGGELADGSDTNAIQEYDSGTGHSVIAGHLPSSVSHASAVTLGGTIYLLGGRVDGAASDRILRFDPSRNVVVGAGHLPRPVFDGAAGTYRDRGYLLGGLGAGVTPLDSVIELRQASRPNQA